MKLVILNQLNAIIWKDQRRNRFLQIVNKASVALIRGSSCFLGKSQSNYQLLKHMAAQQIVQPASIITKACFRFKKTALMQAIVWYMLYIVWTLKQLTKQTSFAIQLQSNHRVLGNAKTVINLTIGACKPAIYFSKARWRVLPPFSSKSQDRLSATYLTVIPVIVFYYVHIYLLRS